MLNYSSLMLSIHIFIQKRHCVKILVMQSNSPRPQASRSWWATFHSGLFKIAMGRPLGRFFGLECKRSSQQQFQEHAEHIPLGLFHLCRCVLGCNTYISILAKGDWDTNLSCAHFHTARTRWLILLCWWQWLLNHQGRFLMQSHLR